MPGGESDISDDETEESIMAYQYLRRDDIHGFDDDDDDDGDSKDDEKEDSEIEDIDVDELHHLRKGANFKNQDCPLWLKAGCLESLEDIFER
ncbi:hypothetical protein N7478_010976 [Penicillium angulare]|uniref:uncharacterized protein n=1 Tax=Penicillium angulare TaxID=116970 RepID=UPI00254113C0|nr:uncharacterized protein N7478_010976 [Penicillium angulare]KAJ5263371.1 hypothetical protein N7478_010976 [Penicillium angulare]